MSKKQTEELKSFSIEVDDWTLLDKASLEYIHNQAERQLDSTVAINHSITSRGVTLLSVYLSVFGVAFSLLIAKIGTDLTSLDKALLVVIILGLLAMSKGFYLIYKLLYPRKYYDAGHPPNRFDYKTLESKKKDPDPLLALLFNQIELLQQEITCNREINATRFNWYKKALKWIGLSITITTLLVASLFVIFH